MEKRKITAPWLKPYIAELKLAWPIAFFSIDGVMCRCSSHPAVRQHEVMLTSGAVSNPSFFLPDILHELCHLKLAEQIERAFSTLVFSKRYIVLNGGAKEEFERNARQLYFAWCLVDVWVDDLRHKHWPHMTQADYETAGRSFLKLVELGAGEKLRGIDVLLEIAQVIALEQRHHLKPIDLTPTLDQLGWERQIFDQLTAFYTRLPRLSYGQRDLTLLQESVQAAIRILGLPIKARLIEEEGRCLWEVESA